MNNMTEAIHTVKSTLTREEWQRHISDCQSSGMSVKAWCEANNVPRGSYYAQLRKLRETILSEPHLVPLSLPPEEPDHTGEIRIESGEIRVTFPADASVEQLTAGLTALKSC